VVVQPRGALFVGNEGTQVETLRPAEIARTVTPAVAAVVLEVADARLEGRRVSRLRRDTQPDRGTHTGLASLVDRVPR
jgi:hypothetical protein